MANQVFQLIVVPHRPVPVEAEINRDLAPAFDILQRAKGLLAVWRGKKHEDRNTQVALVLWENLESSHKFFTSSDYSEFHKVIQPAMNGRKIEWQNHVELDSSASGDKPHLAKTLQSPSIEVALTKVVEGGVAVYHSQYQKIVAPILDQEPGCDGHFIRPLLENPQNQLLLINWKSVDAHHEDFEKKDTFQACITGLGACYAEFVVPWHIVKLELAYGKL